MKIALAALQVRLGHDHVFVAAFNDALHSRIFVARTHDKLVVWRDGLLVLIEPKEHGLCAVGIVALTNKRHRLILPNPRLFLMPCTALVVLLVRLLILLSPGKPSPPILAHTPTIHPMAMTLCGRAKTEKATWSFNPSQCSGNGYFSGYDYIGSYFDSTFTTAAGPTLSTVSATCP